MQRKKPYLLEMQTLDRRGLLDFESPRAKKSLPGAITGQPAKGISHRPPLPVCPPTLAIKGPDRSACCSLSNLLRGKSLPSEFEEQKTRG